MMRTKKIKAIIETGRDGFYSIYLPDITGLYGTGETESEAKEELLNAIDMAKEHVRETQDERDYVLLLNPFELDYRYDLSGFFKTYNFFDISALANFLGLNPSLLRRYKSGITKASDTQKRKIETGIHTIAKRLSTAKF